MDRYLLQELSGFFFFSVSLLSAVGVAIGTVGDLSYKITEYSLPIPVAILIFCYKIPEYVSYALPISVLLTSLVVYGRLNRDRELVALSSFGISFYKIVFPALLCGLAITGITFLLNEFVVPAANFQASLLQNPFIARTESNLNRQDIFYAEYQTNRVGQKAKQLKSLYFAEQYRPPNLQEITIVGFKEGQISRIITARSARWNKEQQAWNLVEGEINQFDRASVEKFEVKLLPLPNTLFKIVDKERSPEVMNIRQAREYLALIADSGRAKEITKLTVRIQQKYAFPFICIVFASIGSALGIESDRLNRTVSFGCCVAIVFGYYCLGFTFGSFGISGVISPFWAAWLPNICGLALGSYLLVNA